ncbi:MAG: RNA 2',3'-cyclic phosphodiesterase [Thermomicrobiales bacterium]
MAESWRLFVAVDLGDAARRELATVQERLHRQPLPVRWVEPTGAHLTLKFLGATDPDRVPAITEALGTVAARSAPFTVYTSAPGAFPNARRPRVLWLGLAGPLERLAAVQEAVDAALESLAFPRETRPFRPHQTLGRVRDGAAISDPGALAATFAALGQRPAAPLPVSALRLMRSELQRTGAQYTPLAILPFGGA